MPTDIRIEATPRAGCLVMTVAGEVDLDNFHQLREAFAGAAADVPLVLDLSQVQFMDSLGLSVLARAHRDRVARGTAPIMVPSAPVAQLLAVSGLDSVLVTRPSLAEALATVDRQGTRTDAATSAADGPAA